MRIVDSLIDSGQLTVTIACRHDSAANRQRQTPTIVHQLRVPIRTLLTLMCADDQPLRHCGITRASTLEP